ncbi:MAG: hypothetical protein JJU27_17315, partial [Gammaproteobacteria bacterium]|nr:hypothetical protein [Gammaproteobacteria bacterium]
RQAVVRQAVVRQAVVRQAAMQLTEVAAVAAAQLVSVRLMVVALWATTRTTKPNASIGCPMVSPTPDSAARARDEQRSLMFGSV